MQYTPLYDSYREIPGVKLIDFGGWHLPLHFAAGITAEHTAVRTAAGLFDVSHMGVSVIRGAGATEYLEYLCSNTVADLSAGACRYTMLCYPDGGVVDDVLIYRIGPESYLVILNAANTEKDLAWLTKENPRAASAPEVLDYSKQIALLALQGPKAREILTPLAPGVEQLASFQFSAALTVAGMPALISRTGYTGEDGYEIFCSNTEAPVIWRALHKAGAEHGLLPCGLGARDTLRIEAKLPLYGQEISETITPLEANLGAFVKLDAKEFCGSDALKAQRDGGVPRTLRGLQLIDAGMPRTGYPVCLAEEEIGMITSGLKSPTLGGFWAFALLDRSKQLPFGTEVDIMIRGKARRARIVKSPFYRRT